MFIEVYREEISDEYTTWLLSNLCDPFTMVTICLIDHDDGLISGLLQAPHPNLLTRK